MDNHDTIEQDLQSRGRVLLVVDQPAAIGALPVAVAQAAGVIVGCLPGLPLRRIADPHPGEAKTDPRDAFIVAEVARTMPHTLLAVQVAEEEQVAHPFPPGRSWRASLLGS